MLRKLNCFLNIVIGSFIGVFIGFGIYKFWHFKTYPNLYAMQSAPWYTELELIIFVGNLDTGLVLHLFWILKEQS